MNNNPIAVIDSGVGGLATLLEIKKAMPKEDIIYFGDTAHMPYGEKTLDELCTYATQIAKFVQDKGAKMLIIACGTLSSVSLESIYKAAPMLLVQDIVSPGIAATSRACTNESIVGVIATQRTIDSGSYQKGYDKLSKMFTYFAKACPKLAPAIEAGIKDGPEMEELLRSYLDELVLEKHIDTLVLGCTHYPVVRETIEKLYPDLTIVDPAQVTARCANSLLMVHEMNAQREEGKIEYYVSKKTEGFSKMAKLLGLNAETITEVNL